MLARRGRLNVKPNLAKGSIRNTEAKPNCIDSKSAGLSDPKPTVSFAGSSSGPDAPLGSPKRASALSPVRAPMGSPVSERRTAFTVASSTALEPVTVLTDLSPTHAGEMNPLSPPRRIAHNNREMMSPRNRLTSTCEVPTNQNRRKKFNGEEELDTKSMRMMDMIYWNPKKEKGMIRKDLGDDVSLAGGRDSRAPSHMTSPVKTAAPQVKLTADGRLVLDESSLVVQETHNDTSIWETVDEDRVTRKVTSLSFRNRMWRKGTSWTEKETEMFYEILRCTGPDFGLMHEFFPSRARNELKSKFNREERSNWEKMKTIMSMPALLDDSLYDRAAKLEKEIENEALAKAQAKEKTGKKKKADADVHDVAKVDWDESTADLVGEAEEIIRQMEKESSRKESGKDGVSSSSSDESSDDEMVIRKKRAPAKKKFQLSDRARRILAASKKDVGVTASVQPPRAAKKIIGYEEDDDESEPKAVTDEIVVVAEVAKPQQLATIDSAGKPNSVPDVPRSGDEAVVVTPTKMLKTLMKRMKDEEITNSSQNNDNRESNGEPVNKLRRITSAAVRGAASRGRGRGAIVPRVSLSSTSRSIIKPTPEGGEHVEETFAVIGQEANGTVRDINERDDSNTEPIASTSTATKRGSAVKSTRGRARGTPRISLAATSRSIVPVEQCEPSAEKNDDHAVLAEKEQTTEPLADLLPVVSPDHFAETESATSASDAPSNQPQTAARLLQRRRLLGRPRGTGRPPL